MTFIQGLKTDLFISFSHVDNDKTHGGDGWIADFEQHLLAALRKQVSQGKEVEVWRDAKLRGNDIITDEIAEKLRGSAVLVSLVSPNYLSSTGRMGCLEELEMFWSNRPQGLDIRVENKLRVFKVLLQDVPLDDQPEKIRGLRGYSFFDKSPKEGWSREFWPRPTDHPDNRYWNRLDELASDIAKLITLIRDKVAAVTASPSDTQTFPVRPSPTSRPEGTVFLAETADDLQNDYYWVRRELERKNLRVLPDEPLPSKRADAETVIKDALEESQIAVHMFSRLYGRRFGQGERSVPHLEHELAIEAAKARSDGSEDDKLSRIAWIPMDVNLDSAEPPQQKLLKEIQTEEIPEAPIDVQRLPHDQLQRLVDSIAAQVLEPELPPPASGALIYFTGMPQDLKDRETKTVIDYIRRRHHDVFMPTAFNDPEKREKQDEAYIKSSDGVVILYGTAPSEWAQNKALYVAKLARHRRTNSLTAVVLDCPPEKEDELNLFSDTVSVLKWRSGFQPRVLHPFLQRVEGVKRTGYEE